MPENVVSVGGGPDTSAGAYVAPGLDYVPTGSGVLVVTDGSRSLKISLQNATTGNGFSEDFATAQTYVSMVVVPNGTVTGGTVRLQCSHDASNWVTFSPDVITAAIGTGVNQIVTAPACAARFWRAQVVSAITGGGTINASIMAS